MIPSGLRRSGWWLALPALVIATLLIFQLGIPLRASRGSWTTGDEPFYLLTAASLVQDGDLDLRNQYATQAYRAFFDHPDPLWYQAVPAPDGRRLTPHNAGLPLLVAPAYQLGGAVMAKRFLALMAALMVGLVYVAAWRLTWQPVAALMAAVALAISAPVVVYASQVYPEMPAALVLAALSWLVVAEPWRPTVRTVLLAVGLTTLPWLGTKYALAGAVVGLFALWRLSRRAGLALLAIVAVTGAHYVWFHLNRYGGLTPYAVNALYAGSDTGEIFGLHLQIWNRLYRLLGLFVDREFGLIRWAPVLVLAFPGSVIGIRRWGWRGWFLVAVFGAQFLIAAFFSITMRGWWFPGRMLVAVLPVVGIWMAGTLAAAASRRVHVVAMALGLLSAWTTLSLWQAAAGGLVRLAVDPFAVQTIVFRFPAPLFPLYTTYALETWLLSGLWLLVLSGLTLVMTRLADRPRVDTQAEVQRERGGEHRMRSFLKLGPSHGTWLLLVAALAALVVFAGCEPEQRPSGSVSVSGTGSKTGTKSGTGTGTHAGTETGSAAGEPVSAEGATPVDVTLQEWSVEPAQSSVTGGKVQFVVTNDGAEEHEFVVLKDGEEVDELHDIHPGETKDLVVELEPGTYELACLLETDGQRHYDQGMHAEFTVEQ